MGSESKSASNSTSQDYSNSFNTNVAQNVSGSGALSILSQGAVDAAGAAYSYLSKTNSDNTTQTFDTSNNQQYSLGANSPISGSASASGSSSGGGLFTSWVTWAIIGGAILLLIVLLKRRST